MADTDSKSLNISGPHNDGDDDGSIEFPIEKDDEGHNNDDDKNDDKKDKVEGGDDDDDESLSQTVEDDPAKKLVSVNLKEDALEDDDIEGAKPAANGDNQVKDLLTSTMGSVFPPNDPHPSLECPPLYFALKPFPKALEAVKALYRWRWSASYPLQKRVCGSRILRKYKIHLTWGELLIFLPLAALAIMVIVQTILVPDVVASGKASRLAVFAALLFGQKNSYLTMVTGIPFDRALLYHKASGYVAVITGLLHGMACMLEVNGHLWTRDNLELLFSDQMNSSGTMILLFMTILFITSIPVIRRKLFELFYFVHIIMLLGVIGGTAVHTGCMVPLTIFLTTGVDFIIRKVFMARFRYPNKASLRLISETVVEVCFLKKEGFDYNPGQYCYLAVPALSNFEWHPFSISTAPHQPKVTFHIRKAGNWTTALHNLAKTTKEIDIMIEGPYGSFGVDIMSEKRYKCLMMLSGGIGLSPMQSMFSHLLHEQLSGTRTLKKLKFVWIQRDPELLAEAAITDTSASLHGSKRFTAEELQVDPDDLVSAEGTSLADMILSSIPAGEETDAELEQQYENFEWLGDVEDQEQTNNNGGDDKTATKRDDDTDVLEMSADFSLGSEVDAELAQLGDVLDIDIHLTKNETQLSAEEMPFVKTGRPDVAALFINMREEAIRQGERRVAVCVCGPKRINHLCRKACVELSDKTVRFDYHEECFGG